MPGRVAQSVGHLIRKSRVLGSIPGLATYFRSPSAFSRRAVVSYWRKYVHEVLVNRLGGLSLPRKSVVKGSSQHQVGGEWFEIELGKISRMLVKYEVLPIPNVISVC